MNEEAPKFEASKEGDSKPEIIAEWTNPDLDKLEQAGFSADDSVKIMHEVRLWVEKRITPEVVTEPDGSSWEKYFHHLQSLEETNENEITLVVHHTKSPEDPTPLKKWEIKLRKVDSKWEGGPKVWEVEKGTAL
ncbi:MAG: hypothetical protein EXS47_02565 [Candidatus Zambryskibacteria bacterium]|nr:hypothetical protein [Candidatus Zambryskibacteria bacterium]